MNPKFVLTIVLVLFLLSACGAEENSSEVSTPEPEPSATPEPALPTPTPEPEPTATEAGPAYEIISDVSYVYGTNSTKKVDLFMPTSDLQQPQTLLMFHGGGSPRGEMYPAALYFAERGYQVVVVGFRDWPKYKYPAAVEDVFCAAAWLGANAEEYGLRIDQLVPYGFSFGATLGTTLVMENDPARFLTECPDAWSDQIGFAGVVGFSGIYDYRKIVEISDGYLEYANDYLGITQEEGPEIWAQASPSTSVDGSEPPFFFIHGLNDNIPVANVQYFADLLEQAGVPVTADYPEDMVHGALVKSTAHLALVEEWLLSLP
ncbi:MAG: alpha/beta hydrolase [Anaerolineales bacterium]